MSIVAYPPIESDPVIIHLEVVVLDDLLRLGSGWGVYILYMKNSLLFASCDADYNPRLLSLGKFPDHVDC